MGNSDLLAQVFGGLARYEIVKYIQILLIVLLQFKAWTLEVIKVGIFNVEPFSYIDSNGKFNGVTFKFLEKLEKAAEFKFEYIVLPYSRVLSSLKDGSIDLAMFYPSDVYKDDYEALCETLGNDNYIVLQPSIKSNSLKQLAGKKIVALRGAKYSKEYEDDKLVQKIDAKNYEQAISMFLAKRVDGIVVPKVALNFLITEKRLARELFSNFFVLNHKKNYLHVRKNLPEEIKSKLKTANLKVIEENGYRELDDLILMNEFRLLNENRITACLNY